MKVLKEFERQHGRTPDALLSKPELPWYYQDILNYYMILSNSRGSYVVTTYKVIKNQIAPQSKLLPMPIDINSILLLAKTTDIMKPKDFLILVTELDSMYLTKAAEKNNE